MIQRTRVRIQDTRLMHTVLLARFIISISVSHPIGTEHQQVYPTCFRCGRSAEEIGEYQDAALAENMEVRVPAGLERITPTDYVVREEGTYNPKTRHFCCTKCYIEIGCPVSPTGWKAP